ncbi:hypothetical protein [Streptomyces puniciscabiei]|uniref:hypothetical protein n=1 Tax=Streptomyces puniciscabiei TaxID=164348 RepID=UPI00142ED56C|nr:hypothetical protein [Streptomyces puniciscabiei]
MAGRSPLLIAAAGGNVRVASNSPAHETRLTGTDDGRDQRPAGAGYGIAGMRERVRPAQGALPGGPPSRRRLPGGNGAPGLTTRLVLADDQRGSTS